MLTFCLIGLLQFRLDYFLQLFWLIICKFWSICLRKFRYSLTFNLDMASTVDVGPLVSMALVIWLLRIVSAPVGTIMLIFIAIELVLGWWKIISWLLLIVSLLPVKVASFIVVRLLIEIGLAVVVYPWGVSPGILTFVRRLLVRSVTLCIPRISVVLLSHVNKLRWQLKN